MMNWYCPECDQTAVTNDVPNRFHNCAGLKGLTAPMILEGTKAKLEVVHREDYSNGDILPTDNEGNVVMSVVTTRDDGIDCTVFASTATGSGEAHGINQSVSVGATTATGTGSAH